MSSNPQNIVTIADLLLQILDPTGITNHLLNEPIPSIPQTATGATGAVATEAVATVPSTTAATDFAPSTLRITAPTINNVPALAALNNSIRLQQILNLLNHFAPTEEEEAEAEANAEAVTASASATATTRPPGLAGFATDRENVHTRPAQTETSRAIQVLMDPAPETWKTLFKNWSDFLQADAIAPDVQAVQTFLADDEPYSVLVGDHEFRTKVSLQDVFCSFWSFAKTVPPDLRSAFSWDLRDLWVLDTSRARIEKVAELLCNWDPTIGGEDISSNWLHYWVTHRHDTLLFSVRNTWCEAITTNNPWRRVIEEPVWTEFRYDVYNTENFDIRYGDLLQRMWDYALAHPDVKNEIGVRLAEEVLDGVGMCPQGKMTRLANVLRGFDPRLESVSTLSTREQLQNRMVTLRSLPMEERRAAAEAVFAELSIPAEEQEPWMDALLE